MASHVIDMGARRCWVVNSTLCPLQPQERDPVLIQEVGRESGPVLMDPKKLSPPGFEPRIIHPLLIRYMNYAIPVASYVSAEIYKPSTFSAIFFSCSVLLGNEKPHTCGEFWAPLLSVIYNTKSCPPFLSSDLRYKEHAIRYNIKACVTDQAPCVAHFPAMETIPPPIFLAYSRSCWMKATEIAFIAYTMSTPTTHFVPN